MSVRGGRSERLEGAPTNSALHGVAESAFTQDRGCLRLRATRCQGLPNRR